MHGGPPADGIGAERARGSVERTLSILFLFGLLLAPIAWAAARAYPVDDDAWLALTPLAANHRALPDRPVFGWLLEAFARIAGRPPAVYVLANAALWAVFALLIGRLWSALFPAWRAGWPAASALALAPIVVETQYTTATLFLPAVVPVCLGLLGLLLVLDGTGRTPGAGRAAAAAAAAMAGAVVSEYGLVFALCAGVLLAGMGLWRKAPPIVIGGLAGYGLFRLVADLTIRDAVDPAAQLGRVSATPWGVLIRVVSGFLYTLAGAFGRAADQMRPQWSSKSTLLALAVGAAVAVLLVRLSRGASRGASVDRRLLLGLAMAIAVGLLAVASQNTFSQLNGYESRLRIPVLPFSIALSLGVLFEAVAPAWRTAAVACLGLLVGYTAVSGAFSVTRTHSALQAAGESVRARLADCPAATLAVVAGVDPGVDSEGLTAKATSRWSPDEAARAWFFRPADAARLLGERDACRPAVPLTVGIGSLLRRSVSPCQAVWISVREGRVAGVEPYCVPRSAAR